MMAIKIKPQFLGYYEATSPNDYYFDACVDLWSYGDETSPKGLLTKELHPTFARISKPRDRIISSIGRVLNIPFALAEVVQILSGQNDAQALKYYNSKIMDFQGDSPDALRFNAAYGERLRHYDIGWGNANPEGVDQLRHIIQTLRKDPDSRQATAVISHPKWDNHSMDTKDRACNLVSHAMIRHGKLDWMQVLRSNDVVFGLPYNIFQWAHVQEYVATALGVSMGQFTFVQDSLHCYEHQFQELKDVVAFDMYPYLPPEEEYPMVANIQDVAHWEKRIRENGPIALPREKDDDYWIEVLTALNAYKCFKDRKDLEVFGHMPYSVELRWPLLRWMVSVRWGKNEKYDDYVSVVRDDLSDNGFPKDKINAWLGIKN
jgi:thymidylate synthase